MNPIQELGTEAIKSTALETAKAIAETAKPYLIGAAAAAVATVAAFKAGDVMKNVSAWAKKQKENYEAGKKSVQSEA